MKRCLLFLGLFLLAGAIPACGGTSTPAPKVTVTDGTEVGLDLVAATTELQDRLTAAPDDPALLRALGNVYARRGLFSEAIATLKDAVRIDAEHGPAWHNLAICYERQQLFREAQAAADTAAALEPDNTYFEQDAGRIAVLLREGESGERAFTEKVSQAYHALNKFDDTGLTYAASLVEDLMRVWPEQAETWNVAGMVAARQGNATAAKLRFDKAIERAPKTLQARFNRALLAWDEEDRAEADRQFAALLNLLPAKDDRGRNYIGQLQADLQAGKPPRDSAIVAKEFPIR